MYVSMSINMLWVITKHLFEFIKLSLYFFSNSITLHLIDS